MRSLGIFFLAGVGVIIHSSCWAASNIPDSANSRLFWYLLFTVALLTFLLAQIFWLRRKLEVANNSLDECSARFHGLMENMHLGALLMDPQHHVLEMSKVMREWFPDVDLATRPRCFKAFFKCRTAESRWFCPTRRALADGQVHRAVTKQIVQGEERLLRIVSCPIRNKDGEIVAALELFDDITEYKRSEVALEEQVHFMQSLLETAPLPIYYKDLNDSLVGCNRAFEDLVGLRRDQIEDVSEWELFTPPWQERSVKVEQAILKGEQRGPYEDLLSLPSGGKRDVIVCKGAYEDVAGAPAGILTVLMDITERKRMEESLLKAEERYRSIFENAVLGIFRTTLEGDFLEASPSLARMLGYDGPEAFVKAPSITSKDIYANPESRQEMVDDIQHRNGIASYENLYCRADGSLFFGSMNVRLVRDQEGNPLYLDGILEDITERKRAEEQLRHAKIEAERASHLKSDFITAVTHELRTPLTSVMGFSKMLRKKLEISVFPKVPKEDDKARKGIAQVRNSLDILLTDAEALSRLIGNVIDLAKLESGQREPHLRPEPVFAILKQAIREARVSFQDTGLGLELDIPQELPHVFCDRDLILDVLRHLLDNAFKFTEQGTVVCGAEVDGDFLHLSVRDTGIGIPGEELEHIFDTFNQLGDTLTDKPKGTGLGLAICHRIIESHGGELLVESVPGQGSVFSFTLPVVAETSQP